MNQTKQTDLDFELHLRKIEDPNYHRETNYDLPENPTPLEKAKFQLCKEILSFKIKNSLTRNEIANKLSLSKAEAEQILFCHIEEFTLDRLINYASLLTNSSRIDIVLHPNPTSINL